MFGVLDEIQLRLQIADSIARAAAAAIITATTRMTAASTRITETNTETVW